ncbi:MAG: hypothetical protein HKN75_03360, partial [Bacteroidia bacterium]|nr:hypothetical protein [Bacteroidia bacterium]
MKFFKFSLILCSVFFIQPSFAQKTIKEYVNKNDSKKLDKAILVDFMSQPATGKSFRDGHGKGPYFNSKEQLPKKVALITFHINDYGVSYSNDYGYTRVTTYISVTESGGNQIASAMHNQTIENLKKKFAENRATLLTPKEFLDTPEKKDYYYNQFQPTVSKIGKFLSNFENRATDISVCADDYRYFDMGAAFDYLRSESLGSELAEKLEVDAVLSIGIVIQTQKKEAYVRTFKMALHGPNPIPKEDKKYVGQKTGVGYYNGQIYSGATFAFKKPIPAITLGKNEITGMDFDGLEVIFDEFIA